MYINYALLINPGHNRVYFESSLSLSLAEFGIVAAKMSVAIDEAVITPIAGIEYLTFTAADTLGAADIKILSDLSFAYALFRMEGADSGNDTALTLNPIAKTRTDYIDESMGRILKYSGKTNEIFTRMLINIAACSTDLPEKPRLLDPVAGKGTTLYEGLIKGYDVYGIEISEGVVNEVYHFVRRFLENARYKFELKSLKISGPDKSFRAQRHTFKTAATKEAYKNKDTRTLEIIAGSALYADKYYKAGFFDMIVGDLPYGIQHGNVTRKKMPTPTRHPGELLSACLPAWLAVLRPGGVIALSWNTHVCPRAQMEEIFMQHDVKLLNEGAYAGLSHRVDQAIMRDVVVWRKEEITKK